MHPLEAQVDYPKEGESAKDFKSPHVVKFGEAQLKKMAWEGVRRQDQIRFCTFTQPTADRYKGVWKNAIVNDYLDDTEDWTCVYPLPSSVLSLNTNLKQNPGY